MNLAGISVALGLITLAFVTMPWGLPILVALIWIYLKS